MESFISDLFHCRQVVRVAGIDCKSCTLFIPSVRQLHSQPYFPTLESFLSLGLDLMLFDASELHVLLERDGQLWRLRDAVLSNLHCVVEYLDESQVAVAKYFDVAVPCSFERIRHDMAHEIAKSNPKV